MNANLTLSEIITIAFILLLVFGPQRLPEMAKKAGELLGKVRQTAASLRDEFTSEYEDLAKPLTDLDAEIKAVKADLTGAIPKIDGLMADPSTEEPDSSDPDAPPRDRHVGNGNGATAVTESDIDDELAQAKREVQQELGPIRDDVKPPEGAGEG